MPKISVIMPVHNRGELLSKSIGTLVKQSLKDFELICVDDASTDTLTLRTLNLYEREYPFTKVVYLKSNVGAGEARNIGFSKARGEYTIFLDSDDRFADDFLEKMYNCIRENKADVCICGYKRYYVKDEKWHSDTCWMPDERKINLDHSEEWLLNIPSVAWNKLCRTQFLKENRIYFQPLATCNDIFFSCRVMINAVKRCCVEENSLIFYRSKTKNQLSATRNPLDLYKAMELLFETEENNKRGNLLPQWVGAFLLRNGSWESKKCSSENFQYEYYRQVRDFFDVHNIHFKNELLEACANKIRKFPYENSWFSHGINFLDQLRLVEGKLKKGL